MPFERLGKYEIKALIGSGAMGDVYKAWDPVLNRFVAIKVIAPTLVSDQQFRQRFLREARSAAGLNHRNIVTVFEFNEEAEQVFMVMEFLEGTDLREAIAYRRLDRIEDKLAVIEQVCDGLGFAHRKDIVHRDLKPANLRLLPNLSPKIMDFGLARLGASEITRAGTVMGTPDYMAPEQVRGDKVDPRADIFSVGAVLYHLLSGRKPFASASMQSIFREVLERDPPPLRSLAPDLPPLVVPIVERAMEKDAARRFQSADALRDALRDARRAIAAGRAVAAALMPGLDDEPTLTRMDVPPYVSSASVAGVSRPGVSSASPPNASLSSVNAPTVDLPPSPPTVVLGATALELSVPGPGHREGSTARPLPTLVGKKVEPPQVAHLVLVAVAVAILTLGGLAFAAFRWLRPTTRPVVDFVATEGTLSEHADPPKATEVVPATEPLPSSQYVPAQAQSPRQEADAPRRSAEGSRSAVAAPTTAPTLLSSAALPAASTREEQPVPPAPPLTSAAPPATAPPAAAPAASLPPPETLGPAATAPVTPEPAVRRVLADYARALEARDIELFKTVMARLSADDERRVRESFKSVKSHRVRLSVASVRVEGSRAMVEVARQDTVNGQELKPLRQTFRLVQADGAWTIESIGQ